MFFKLNYTMGIQVMGQLLGSGLKDDVDLEALIAAQRDLFNGKEPQMTGEEMQLAQQAYMQKRQQQFQKHQVEKTALRFIMRVV